MGKLEKYAATVKTILTDWANYGPQDDQIETLLIFDDDHKSYQIMIIGWQNNWRSHGSLVHIRIKNDKLWVEEDGTEEGITNKLLEAGIPKEDIVLAFHPEWKRKYTDFAVA